MRNEEVLSDSEYESAVSRANPFEVEDPLTQETSCRHRTLARRPRLMYQEKAIQQYQMAMRK